MFSTKLMVILILLWLLIITCIIYHMASCGLLLFPLLLLPLHLFHSIVRPQQIPIGWKTSARFLSKKLWIISGKMRKLLNFLGKLNFDSDLEPLLCDVYSFSHYKIIDSFRFTNQREFKRTNRNTFIVDVVGGSMPKIKLRRDGLKREKSTVHVGGWEWWWRYEEMAIKRWNPIVLLLPLCSSSSTHSK